MTVVTASSVREAAAPWLPTWRAEHTRRASIVLWVIVFGAIVVSHLAPGAATLPIGAQVFALVVAVAVFGVPHGALDPLVGRRWLAPRLGARWWAPFHAAYVLLAAAVVAGWALAPAATLAVFLVASAVHFGLGDVDRAREPLGFGWAALLARGAAPIVVPAAAHPAAVRQAFGWVAAGATPAQLNALVTAAAVSARWAVLPACAALAVAHLAAARRARGAPPAAAHRADALECLAVPALAWALPPFLGFLVYFCLLHSTRHALALAAALDPARPARAWARFAREALPATAVTLALGVAVWAALASAPAGADRAAALAPAAVRVLFAGLAALTAPHMLLTALAGEPDESLTAS